MLSNSCIKSAVERFNALETGAIEAVRDEKLREQALALKKKEGGFTLLELLVVVAILAIVAGTMLGALAGQEKRASSGAGANSIAAVESLLKGYQASGTLLNDLDALESVSAATTLPTAVPAIAADAPILPIAVIGSKLSGDKLTVAALDQKYVDSLISAGITKVRVLATEAINEDTTDACTALVEGILLPCDQKMSEIDISGRIFDNPNGSATASKNRGRGFSVALPTTGGAVLPVWKSGSVCDATIVSATLEKAIVGGLDNTKLGAKKCDVLVALGFGNNAIIGASSTPQMNSAPAYGGMLGNQYNRYIALYNVGKGLHASNRPTGVPSGGYLVAAPTAKLQAIVDTRGDFLDEELAEASGQKQ